MLAHGDHAWEPLSMACGLSSVRRYSVVQSPPPRSSSRTVYMKFSFLYSEEFLYISSNSLHYCTVYMKFIFLYSEEFLYISSNSLHYCMVSILLIPLTEYQKREGSIDFVWLPGSVIIMWNRHLPGGHDDGWHDDRLNSDEQDDYEVTCLVF